jgi:mono/diheme cytochrome c family protein
MRLGAVGLGLIGMLVSACGRPDAREFRDFERMRRQKRYDAYDVSSFFANGASMQAAPESTVSVESAGAAPPAATPEMLSRGEQKYSVSCAPCHGVAGFGGGLVAANLTERRPPSLRNSRVTSMAPSELFAILTGGKGTMPALGWQLSPVERWAIVAYVQSLSGATSTVAADARRADSLMANYLQQIDSMHAAGAPIEAIARLQRPRDCGGERHPSH